MNWSSESESERRNTATRMHFKYSESNMQRCTHCNKSEVFAKMLHILHIYAEYAVYAVYAQYAPSHILHICCISSIRTPGRPSETLPGSGCIFSFFYIYIPNMQFFWGRCIYMGGRCICAIFGIFSWNHGVGCLSA
jgi:hypothetical protein